MLAKNKISPYAGLHPAETKLVTVDVATATEYTGKYAFKRQRDIRQRHVNSLASKMRNGTFLPWTQLYFCELPDGSLQLVDGYHRLNAVIQSGITVPFVRTIHKVSNAEEVGKAYSRIDLQLGRKPIDAAKGTGLDEKIPNIKVALAAMQHVLCRFAKDDNKEDITKDRDIHQATLLNEYQTASYALEAARADGVKGYLPLIMTGPVYAVALVTTAIKPEAALEFWGAVMRNEGHGLQPKGQWKVLFDYLSTHKGGEAKYWQRIRAAAFVWNAYYVGKDIKNIPARVLLKTRPVHILGTAFDNRPIEERGGPTRTRLGPK
jgi:hypothetical protein